MWVDFLWVDFLWVDFWMDVGRGFVYPVFFWENSFMWPESWF